MPSRYEITYVQVTNKNTFLHRDMWDGEYYYFPKNQTVEIPELAARHFFGYGLEEQPQDAHLTDTLTRQGWNLPMHGKQAFRWGVEEGQDGMELLKRFIIKPIETKRGRGAERIPHASAPAAS